MNYDVVITNGLVLSAEGETRADVAIRGETIAAVGPGLAAAKRRAARRSSMRPGRLVIPGGVDVHVHLELPFCGTVSSDDWNTGTRAAARGGVTTVIDFAIPYGQESLIDAYQQLDGPGQAQGVRRLLLPHRHHQLGSPRPRDGEARRRWAARPSRSS